VNQMQDISDTALHDAVVRRKGLSNYEAVINIVQMLLKSGAEANALNDRGETPLYLACKPLYDYKINVDIVQTLYSNTDQIPTYVRPTSARHQDCARMSFLLYRLQPPPIMMS